MSSSRLAVGFSCHNIAALIKVAENSLCWHNFLHINTYHHILFLHSILLQNFNRAFLLHRKLVSGMCREMESSSRPVVFARSRNKISYCIFIINCVNVRGIINCSPFSFSLLCLFPHRKVLAIARPTIFCAS